MTLQPLGVTVKNHCEFNTYLPVSEHQLVIILFNIYFRLPIVRGLHFQGSPLNVCRDFQGLPLIAMDTVDGSEKKPPGMVVKTFLFNHFPFQENSFASLPSQSNSFFNSIKSSPTPPFDKTRPFLIPLPLFKKMAPGLFLKSPETTSGLEISEVFSTFWKASNTKR